ncbi:MAG TPA: SBBP repeat-containing protein [Candidatus Cloacimonadota bacterium]|mgnify:CR=1 FL=1|jgi:hypothetical protein|nr:SBBP repeat-containing protein [Candidatus Cloacimonadota bacterium]HOF59394.1 SBBP repeat-containing protein [Candidatus Cloacimonadota bacterium]HOR58544.1 SBBP repeat-containing protein [Candidatus Cloacimonadota bacterium]HPB09007.1 SBBP repeat-containing protein [Candidatus Cloacimonadota bacterium]HQL12767.1 SBBP repeat-containing protein [Candidatus Cloacimonadota bacterium]
MKEKVYLVCLLLLAYGCLTAQAAGWNWAVSAGSSSTDKGWAVDRDAQGNVYICGEFSGSATFGSNTLSSRGGADIFVAKLDAEGNWLWVSQAGGNMNDIAYDVAVDTSGNVLVTGLYRNGAVFGNTTLSSTGSYTNIFVAKLDANGNWLWATRAGAGSANDEGRSLALDSSGNAIVTGCFRLTAYFGSYPITSSGNDDIFVAKISPAGTWLWAKKAGGDGQDRGYGVTLDSGGNIWLTGKYESTASFGDSSLTSLGGSDIFVARLDSSGNWLWATSAGGSQPDEGKDLVCSPSGGAYLCGIFRDGASFGAITLTGAGENDIFAAALDGAGNWLWASNAGGTLADHAYGIGLDAGGGIGICGTFQGQASFGSHSLASSGYGDIFAARLDNQGAWTWAQGWGGADNDFAYGLQMDSGGDLLLCGSYAASFNLGAHPLVNTGGADIFAAELSWLSAPQPREPEGLQAERIGSDIRLCWLPVAYDTAGNQLSPSGYRVYYQPQDADGVYQYLGVSSSTDFIHSGAAALPRGFYKVTAFTNR